ncbi:MAG: ribonuclease H-like domain-containing protein [Kiritimatiellae bacterium]|nr:ribonuclease H-like domain-containing protein [Kiritimatiellia bacterium]MDW8458879.1 ribonuclease H-like domain-containing protein [Verrucomicrobiota bacterium]
MLRRTFVHLPGVGERTERRWWARGLSDWAKALESDCSADQRDVLEQSIRAYEAGNWAWFERAIPAAYKWRVWGELADRALFVDLETDGGMGPESITVIGAYDGRRYRAFVAGENLQEAADYLESFPLLVTFNGSLFDLPLLRARFTHRLRNHLHLDLRYPLQRLGLRGGLKRVEKALGLARSPETDGLDGWDAVRLWREWVLEGSHASLARLLAYNEEDVRNLRVLADWMFARHQERLALDPP